MGLFDGGLLQGIIGAVGKKAFNKNDHNSWGSTLAQGAGQGLGGLAGLGGLFGSLAAPALQNLGKHFGYKNPDDEENT